MALVISPEYGKDFIEVTYLTNITKKLYCEYAIKFFNDIKTDDKINFIYKEIRKRKYSPDGK